MSDVRIFISYARVDKIYCTDLNKILDTYDTWYDQRIRAGDPWWQQILRRLDWCDVFVYLMTDVSIRSEYCLKEFYIARQYEKTIIPILIEPNLNLPPTLAELQYIDASVNGFDTEFVKTLMHSIFATSEPDPFSAVPVARNVHHIPGNIDYNPTARQPLDVVMRTYATAMDEQDFDKAVHILHQAKHEGIQSDIIPVDELLMEAESYLRNQQGNRKKEMEYKSIHELVKGKFTRKHGCRAFQLFQQKYPDYDPQNLAKVCQTSSGYSSVSVKPVQSQIAQENGKSFQMPNLKWCEISGGYISVPKGSKQEKVYIDGFSLAKYPTTNQQFQLFIDAGDGYFNERWWGYSTYALDWFRNVSKPKPSAFNGDDRPRENVNWYEALAYCNWLSYRLNARIILPTQYQWQRAAQGDKGNTYPWGNRFSPDYCNTRESRIRMTTIVTRYKRWASPFDVVDMSGNVWEWCLNGAVSQGMDTRISTNSPRSVKGGSYLTSKQRAEVSFTYELEPEYYYATIGFRVACLNK